VTERHERAWDCATGNGQVAVALAEFFNEVIATDASAEQVAHAQSHPRVRYAVAPAEASELAAVSFDLVTVGQALHWFDLDAFFAEADRVLRPGGVLAAWTYALMTVDPAVDARVVEFGDGPEGLAGYWPPERKLVDEGYASIDFPFESIEVPAIAMEAVWSLDRFVGYLGTWSAMKAYREQTNHDPIPELRGDLAPHWGEGERAVRWPLSVIVRRKPH
jgi:SAM-dependent methyltransferase